MRWLAAALLPLLLAAGEPAWWGSAPADGRRYGRGLGATPEAARDQALADLALQLIATISVERETQTVLASGSQGGELAERSAFRQRLESRLAQLPGVEVVARAEADGLHYALVAVAPEALRAAWMPQLSALDRTLAALPLARPEPVTAPWAARLRAALPLAEERALLAAALAGLGSPPPAPPCTPERLRALLGALVAVPWVVLLGEAEAPGLAAGLRRAADAAGIAVANAAAPWTLRLRETVHESRLPRGWTRVRIVGEVSLARAHEPAVLAVLAAEGEAVSTQDAAAALRQARERLAERIAEEARQRLPGIFAAQPPP